ncbi:MAG: hypothetical protein MUF73_09335 [Rhodobacteraceae bacterium]|jgi:hypothetical protein|nr:hypothetical protein [Paracoccaceae bacterium]
MDVEALAAEVAELLETRLGVRGATFEVRVARARRRLPAALRVAAADLVEARRMAAHPRLARRIDGARVARAHAALVAHLTALDRAAARRAAVLDFLATTGFQMLAVAGLVLAVLVWRGFL